MAGDIFPPTAAGFITSLWQTFRNSAAKLRRPLSVTYISYTILGREVITWLSGFPKKSGKTSDTDTSSRVPYLDTRTLIRQTTDGTPLPPLPERVVRTTYSWNYDEIPLAWSNAFWLGWANGYAKISGLDDPWRELSLGAMFNRELHDMGLLLGQHGVNGRDAMVYLVQYCSDVALDHEKRSEW